MTANMLYQKHSTSEAKNLSANSRTFRLIRNRKVIIVLTWDGHCNKQIQSTLIMQISLMSILILCNHIVPPISNSVSEQESCPVDEELKAGAFNFYQIFSKRNWQHIRIFIWRNLLICLVHIVQLYKFHVLHKSLVKCPSAAFFTALWKYSHSKLRFLK
jgi:riboflavin synthase